MPQEPSLWWLKAAAWAIVPSSRPPIAAGLSSLACAFRLSHASLSSARGSLMTPITGASGLNVLVQYVLQE